LSTGNCDYLHDMTQDIQSMVWSISNWGAETSGGIDWLEHGVCTGTCDRFMTETTLKNLAFITADYVQPDYTVYKYGDKCDYDSTDCESACGEDCYHC